MLLLQPVLDRLTHIGSYFQVLPVFWEGCFSAVQASWRDFHSACLPFQAHNRNTFFLRGISSRKGAASHASLVTFSATPRQPCPPPPPLFHCRRLLIAVITPIFFFLQLNVTPPRHHAWAGWIGTGVARLSGRPPPVTPGRVFSACRSRLPGTIASPGSHAAAFFATPGDGWLPPPYGWLLFSLFLVIDRRRQFRLFFWRRHA